MEHSTHTPTCLILSMDKEYIYIYTIGKKKEDALKKYKKMLSKLASTSRRAYTNVAASESKAAIAQWTSNPELQ